MTLNTDSRLKRWIILLTTLLSVCLGLATSLYLDLSEQSNLIKIQINATTKEIVIEGGSR